MSTTKKTHYAEGTEVSRERTQLEILKVLKGYGATDVVHGEQGETATIGFAMRGRLYRLSFSYPPLSQFAKMPNRPTVWRTKSAQIAARDKEIRRLWRALYLVVKAKLEAAQSDIVSFEQEFLAYTVLRNGATVAEWFEQEVVAHRLALPEPGMLPDILIEGEIIE